MLTADCALPGEIPIQIATDHRAEVLEMAVNAAHICSEWIDPCNLADLLDLNLADARKLWDGISHPPAWLCGALLIAMSRHKICGAPDTPEVISALVSEEVWIAYQRLHLQPDK